MSTPWLAPEMRVVVVPATGGDATADTSPGAFAGLVQSVRVEQLANDVSKATIVLANFRSDGPSGRQHPPWRFDKLDFLQPGVQLRIDARYVGGAAFPQETVRLQMPQAGKWFPLIRVRVTDLRFSFPQSGAAQLTLQGDDLLSMFRAQPTEAKPYPPTHEHDIATDVLTRAGVTSVGSSLGTPKIANQNFGSKRRQKQHAAGTTYLAFLQEMAKEIDYEVFVAFDQLPSANGAESPSSAVSLHFERTRSMQRGVVIDLLLGLNLLSFQPALAFWEAVTSVRGRGRDPNNHRAFTVPESPSSLTDAVTTDLGTESAAVKRADEVRTQFQTGGPAEARGRPMELTGLDKERGERRIQAAMLEAARKFLTAEVETIGLPSLRPGIHVKIEGFRAPFDGHYYVTKAVHSLDGSGYKTTLSVRRPGYTDPSTYPFSAGGA